MSCVDNKYTRSKNHPQMLSEIVHELHTYLKEYPDAILIREEALQGSTKGTVKTIAVLHKVVGVSDLYGWASGNREFDEIAPRTVKRLITGKPNAEKDEVAKGLEKYVGKLEYECDDMSDAVAVGIAWLIQKKYIEKLPEPETSPSFVPIKNEGGK